MIQAVAKLLKVLNSETDPAQISLAVCLAMVAGFTPFFSLHNVVVLLLVLILRVNLSAFLLAATFFKGIAYILDPLFHQVGLAVLKSEALTATWTDLYNNPYWRLARFNNTVLMGSLLVSVILFVPAYFAGNFLIKKYRENILGFIEKTRIMQAFKASDFYSIYKKIEFIRGNQ